jgi:hypothetical protein
MKKNKFLLLFFLIITNVSFSQVYVNGYFKNNGTYVQPHFRTEPNRTLLDNWSTKGNINPFTGKEGWIEPYEKYSYFIGGIGKPVYESYISKKEIIKIFKSLEKKDSVVLFNLLRNVKKDFKTFITGLYFFNEGDYRKSYKEFQYFENCVECLPILKEESKFWIENSKMIIDSYDEIENFLDSTTFYDKRGDFENIKRLSDKVKYETNFRIRDLTMFLFTKKYKKYKLGIEYLNDWVNFRHIEMDSSIINNYQDVLDDFIYSQNYLDIIKNNKLNLDPLKLHTLFTETQLNGINKTYLDSCMFIENTDNKNKGIKKYYTRNYHKDSLDKIYSIVEVIEIGEVEYKENFKVKYLEFKSNNIEQFDFLNNILRYYPYKKKLSNFPFVTKDDDEGFECGITEVSNMILKKEKFGEKEIIVLDIYFVFKNDTLLRINRN